ncbi:unnamed protein product [Echinostoma caproni]|uniref:Uncharacterized protein n=1 Tax=Echinostoma caproni TaxID=27848 RepID=A0A183A3F9_9TREM|nr:unnamed protein product [Echinostoma caproni]
MLAFSEALFPSMRNEPDPSVMTENTVEGWTRYVIWLPVHYLAYDNFVVSKARHYTRCALQRPPPTSLVGMDHINSISNCGVILDMDGVASSNGDELQMLRTARSVRPDPFTVAIGRVSPKEILVSEKGERRALCHVTSSTDFSSKRSSTEAADQMYVTLRIWVSNVLILQSSLAGSFYLMRVQLINH